MPRHRIPLGSAGPPAILLAVAGTLVALSDWDLLPLLLIAVIMIIPGFVWRRPGPNPPGPDDGGGGGGPPVPPAPPSSGSPSGVPLDDATPAPGRLRSHGESAWTRRRVRRPDPAPHRAPARRRIGR